MTQIPMNKIQQWSSTNKFQLHPIKCKELCISFTHIKLCTLVKCFIIVFYYSVSFSINMERIQKRVMRIIHGYDTPYEQALSTPGIPSLSQRRCELCTTFFDKIVVQQEGQLYKLLQSNITKDQVNLRRKCPFVVPCCETNQFRNTFLNKSVINYNKIHSL